MTDQLLRLGFTGTRNEPSEIQKDWLWREIVAYGELHHGACVGADACPHNKGDTMTECTRCKAKAEQFGCPHCVSKLRKLLADLPEWLAELELTAAGQAKLGGPVRRSPRYRRPLDGDAHPLAAYPDERQTDLTQARHDREEAVLRDALARGRVNARASELADKAHAILTEWVRDLCETRGITFPTFTTARPVHAETEDQPPPPWIDATTIHVADGNPGQLCAECFTYHRGSCL